MLKIIFVIIGTIIGAGFASGQEIILFFQRFGWIGFLGLLFSNFITACVIYQVLNIVWKKDIYSYKDFLEQIIGRKKKTVLCINSIVNSFLMISFYIMIAGFGAYFFQEFKIPSYIGAFIGGGICLFIFYGNVKGIVKVNQVLIPFLIFLICMLGYVNLSNMEWKLVTGTSHLKGIINSISYASYNSILLIPILVSMKEFIKEKKQIKVIALFCFLIFTSLAMILFFLLNSFPVDSSMVEIPILHIASQKGKLFQYLYGGVILAAILTSAISAGYGLLNNITKSRRAYIVYNGLLCVTGILISQFGFSNLVEILYPVFGYLGLLQIIFVFRKNYCQK